jgi:hypothetical protein
VHETREELDALQRILDESYATAGAHLRSIFTPARRMSAEQLCGVLRGVCIINLATVNQHSAPRVAPVDGLFYRGRFWFGTSTASHRIRHLRRRPHVSATYVRGEALCIMTHGTAHFIRTSDPEHAGFHQYNREVYGPEYDSWGYWETARYAWIEPERMYAFALALTVASG